MQESISNNPNTGTTREQQDGNASYTEILDVADYEVQPHDSSPAKSFAKAAPMNGWATAPHGATVADIGKIAAVLGGRSKAADSQI